MYTKLVSGYVVLFLLAVVSHFVLANFGVSCTSTNFVLPTFGTSGLNFEMDVTKMIIDVTKYILGYMF